MNVVIEEADRWWDVSDVIARSPMATNPLATSYTQNFIRYSQEIWVGKVDGVVACVWGVVLPSLLSGSGYLWLLTTDLCDQHKFVLIRRSQREIERLLQTYSSIHGDCAVEDLRAQRWLEFLGAKFGRPNPKTIPFTIERKHGSG